MFPVSDILALLDGIDLVHAILTRLWDRSFPSLLHVTRKKTRKLRISTLLQPTCAHRFPMGFMYIRRKSWTFPFCRRFSELSQMEDRRANPPKKQDTVQGLGRNLCPNLQKEWMPTHHMPSSRTSHTAILWSVKAMTIKDRQHAAAIPCLSKIKVQSIETWIFFLNNFCIYSFQILGEEAAFCSPNVTIRLYLLLCGRFFSPCVCQRDIPERMTIAYVIFLQSFWWTQRRYAIQQMQMLNARCCKSWSLLPRHVGKGNRLHLQPGAFSCLQSERYGKTRWSILWRWLTVWAKESTRSHSTSRNLRMHELCLSRLHSSLNKKNFRMSGSSAWELSNGTHLEKSQRSAVYAHALQQKLQFLILSA